MSGFNNLPENTLQRDCIAALPDEVKYELSALNVDPKHVHQGIRSRPVSGDTIGSHAHTPIGSPFGQPYTPQPTHPYGSIGQQPWPNHGDTKPIVDIIKKAFNNSLAKVEDSINKSAYLQAQLYHKIITITDDESLAKMVLITPAYVWNLFQLDKYDTGIHVNKNVHVHRGAGAQVVFSNPKVKVVLTPLSICFEGVDMDISDKSIKNDLIPILIYFKSVIDNAEATKNKEK